MKIVQEDKPTPLIFEDLKEWDVFCSKSLGWVYIKTKNSNFNAINCSTGATGHFSPREPVTHYPDATLHLGAAK